MDGVIDPFFLYYANTYIGNRIELPAITFAEFKENEYYKNREKKGNYVSENFQGCSGWEITADDYKEIKRILISKGFDVSLLPSLPEYEALDTTGIVHEKDVTNKLLIPLLERMGFVDKKDIFHEVEFPAGRTTTGYGSDKRPDICLHVTGTERNKSAQVVIEMKNNMTSMTQVQKDFEQGVSYAKWGEARIYILAYRTRLFVFERNRDNKFVFNKHKLYTWQEMSDNSKYIELKRLLEKK